MSILNKADFIYHDLLTKVLQAPSRGDRTGTGTRSIFGYQMRFENIAEFFPLITTKKVWWNGVVSELLWMLSGSTNIRPLVLQNNHIWNDWPLKHYNKSMLENFDGEDRQLTKEQFIELIKTNEEFAAKWGELGPVYGKQWRKWQADYAYKPIAANAHEFPVRPFNEVFQSNLAKSVEPENGIASVNAGFYAPIVIDQIQDNIDQLLKSPESRRILTLGWNPADIEEMKVSGLPPCHMMVQFYTRPMTLVQRSHYYEPSVRGDARWGAALRGDEAHKEYYEKLFDEAKVPQRLLDAQVYIRSNDLFLGAPFNIAQYALMTHLIAKTVNMVPGDLVYTIGDAHIYNNHIDQVKEQLSRQSVAQSPKLVVNAPAFTHVDQLTREHLDLIGYEHAGAIKAPVAV